MVSAARGQRRSGGHGQAGAVAHAQQLAGGGTAAAFRYGSPASRPAGFPPCQQLFLLVLPSALSTLLPSLAFCLLSPSDCPGGLGLWVSTC